MKKTTRNILIMLAVLAVLGGAVAFLLLAPSQNGEDEVSSSSVEPVSSTPAETITDRETTEVVSVSVENREGNFVLVADGENFVVQGYEDGDVNSLSVTTSVSSLLSLTSTKNLGSRDDLESFGLSGDNSVSVEIKYQDGSMDQLVLGSPAAESSGRYVLKDGTVYITSGVNQLLYGSMYGFFNTTLYTIEDRTEEVTDDDGNTSEQTLEDILYSLKLSGAKYPEPVEIKYEPSVTSSYLISSPILAESGSEEFQEIMTALKAPEASSVAAVGVTSEVLEEFGLAEPYARAEFDLNNTQHTLTVSKPDADGVCYLLLDDRDTVYRVSKDTVSPWTDVTLMQLRMSYIWLPNIMDVSKLSLTVEGDEAYQFDITRVKDEEKSTETNTSYNLTIKNAGGEDIDYKTAYQPFYKALIGQTVLSTDRPEYDGEPVLQVEYDYFDNSRKTDRVEFYAAGEDRYAAVVNGTFNGLVRRNDLDKLMDTLPDVNANKDLSD